MHALVASNPDILLHLVGTTTAETTVRGAFPDDVQHALRVTPRADRRGVMRACATATAEKYLAAYAEGTWGALTAFSPIARGEAEPVATRMEVVNNHFRQGGQHRFSYDAETLQLALRNAGFVEVNETAYGSSRRPELAIDAPARAEESLYVEASASI